MGTGAALEIISGAVLVTIAWHGLSFFDELMDARL